MGAKKVKNGRGKNSAKSPAKYVMLSKIYDDLLEDWWMEFFQNIQGYFSNLTVKSIKLFTNNHGNVLLVFEWRNCPEENFWKGSDAQKFDVFCRVHAENVSITKNKPRGEFQESSLYPEETPIN